MSWSRSTTTAAAAAMDEQALLGLHPHADAGLRQRAAAYFERLTESRDASSWEVCAEALREAKEGPYYRGTDDAGRVHFFCFQVLEHRVRHGHGGLSGAQRELLRDALMTWLRRQTSDDDGVRPEAAAAAATPCVRNKAAQVLALTFAAEYPAALWPAFFSDVASLAAGLRPRGVDVYLRTLAAVGAEVADDRRSSLARSPEETRRGAAVREAMWERCVPAGLVESWFQILSTYRAGGSSPRHPELARRCLEVVASFVSWIDLELVANERFVGLLLAHMSSSEEGPTRGQACDCLREMVGRGADPAYKTRLVESLCRLLQAAGLFSCVEEGRQRHDEDPVFLARFSRLVRSMGQALALAWSRLVKSGSSAETAGRTLRVMESEVVPPTLALLLHPDRGVSADAVAFLCDYLHVLKQLPPPLTAEQDANVRALTLAVTKKLAYDFHSGGYDFEREDEDEGLTEYRKQLKMLLDRLALLSPDVVVAAVGRLFASAVQNWRAAPTAEVEVALRLLCMLGEALPVASPHARFSREDGAGGALQDMTRTLVSSGVSGHGHPAVSLGFFEAAVRHAGFFQAEPRHVPDVLMAFLDGRGLRCTSARVRSRVACLFARFVRAQRDHVASYAEDVLSRMKDLLELATTPRPENHVSSLAGIGDDNDDQLFLFEAAGVLIACSGHQSPGGGGERKQALLRSLLSPLTDAFARLLARLPQETRPDRQAALAACLSHAAALAGRTSKAFVGGGGTAAAKQQHDSCAEVYRDCLHAFLPALACPVQRGPLRSAVRSFLRHMVACLEEDALPFVAAASEHLLLTGGGDCEASDLQDFVPLLAQIAAKFKGRVSPFLRQVFMPLVLAVFGALARPDTDDRDAALDRAALRRSYFSFVHTVVVDVPGGADQILAEQGADNVERVLHTLVQGAADFPEDPTAQRTCFAVLTRLVELWGGRREDNGGGFFFPDFVYKHVVPACFAAPLRPAFDLSDAQAAAALSECALTLRAVQAARGGDFTRFLARELLPALGVPPQLAQELCGALQQPDVKVLKSYVKAFFQRARL